MEMQLQEHMKSGVTARIVAGFFWPWSNAQNGQLVDDVTIGDWAKPWNNKGERRIGDAPPVSALGDPRRWLWTGRAPFILPRVLSLTGLESSLDLILFGETGDFNQCVLPTVIRTSLAETKCLTNCSTC